MIFRNERHAGFAVIAQQFWIGAILAVAMQASASEDRTEKRLPGPTPQWIWQSDKTGDARSVYFRKTFEILGAGDEERPAAGLLTATGDNVIKVWLNGKLVIQSREWNESAAAVVSDALRSGENVIAAEVRNASGPAGFILRLAQKGGLPVELKDDADEIIEVGAEGDANADGPSLEIMDEDNSRYIVTDPSWRVAPTPEEGWRKPGFDASGWEYAVALGELGVGPWGDVGFVEAAKRITPLVAWRFAHEPGPKGWKANEDAEVMYIRASLRVTSRGNEPWIHHRLNVPGGDLALTLRTTTLKDAHGQLYWRTQKHPDYGEARSKDFTIENGGGWREQKIYFQAGSNLTGLRIEIGDSDRPTYYPIYIQSILLDREAPPNHPAQRAR